jgi:ribosomal-protein-alanine N-acetyltransferase
MSSVPQLINSAVAPGSLARLGQPVLNAGEFVLRPWQASDAAAVVRAYAEPSIQRWHLRTMTDDEAREWVDSWCHRWTAETGGGWAIADGPRVLGQMNLRRLNLPDGAGEVSYWVVPAARGRRVATRALCTLSTWVFGELQLHRLEVAHSTLNPASCRVALNAGYQFEGTKRGEGLHTDGWHDMHLHARLADDEPPSIR